MPLGPLLHNTRVFACTSVQTRQLKGKKTPNNSTKKAFKVIFNPTPLLSSSQETKLVLAPSMGMHQSVSPCYFSLVSPGLQRSWNRCQRSANSWPDESCPVKPFTEQTLTRTPADRETSLTSRHTREKQALLIFFSWGCHGVNAVKPYKLLRQHRNKGS